MVCGGALLARTLMVVAMLVGIVPASQANRPDGALSPPPIPQPAKRTTPRPDSANVEAERLKRITAVASWGYQLANADIGALAASPFDLLVIDATTGLSTDKPLTRADVERLKRKPDGGRRLVVSYLSIGEAEDYRPEYFSKEYLEEEAPDWMLHENPDWKGNRLVNICAEGWQKTMLGDAQGRSVYDSVSPSPLQRLVELGLDGVYLDRVDVYEETKKQCPDGEARMVDFVIRLAAQSRRTNPHFLVIQQNAEALLDHPRLVRAIDAVAKESLFYGWGDGRSTTSVAANSEAGVRWSSEQLNKAKAAGRAIFTVDYTAERANMATALKRSRERGYIPYIAPKALDQLWLPRTHF